MVVPIRGGASKGCGAGKVRVVVGGGWRGRGRAAFSYSPLVILGSSRAGARRKMTTDKIKSVGMGVYFLPQIQIYHMSHTLVPSY